MTKSRIRTRVSSLSASAILLTALAFTAHAQSDLESIVGGLEWRELGPTIMGGRVADLAVDESNPAIFYVGTATGGLWRTTSHGAHWEPLFEDQPTSSIGDVTLAPSNSNLIWVGTGEPQNRQSSPWGNGVYKSTDAGRTWTHMGLAETHHIARIVIHPANPDVVYVAAVGHLWGANPERGVYRTTDGGVTWEKVLYVDEHTGAIDMVMDPSDPETLFAAMYQRRRAGYGFDGGGPGSGIYRTFDGGETWNELVNGLPEGEKGRIGLEIYRRDGNIVYAIVQARGGQGVYRSTDRGDSWEQLSETNNRPMYYSQVWIDPNDPDRIYLGGSRLFVSSDGGKTFTNDGAQDVHLDHHTMWIDPNNSNHMILGGDGGVTATFDRGEHWRQYRNLPIAQFYEIGVDMRDPYHVCGGLQDNGSWCVPTNTRSNQGIRTRDWYNVGSGDGFYTLIDPNDPTLMFAESQGGNLTRVNLTAMERTRIRPVLRTTDAEDEEEEPRRYRFNWDTPIVMSAHNSARIYIGANVLLRSTDRGMSWSEISHDLTTQIDRDTLEIMGVKPSDRTLSQNDGISSSGNITAIAESPLNADLLYVGTDDGNVHVTRDGGTNWTEITANFRNLPARTYVTRLVASRANEGTVYAAFDGHRNDDFAPYVFVSDDYGERWESKIAGLPDGWSINAFAEHHRNSNLLFVGNEVGVYFSVDRGESWVRLKNNLPTVPVDDIVIHPRENDLVIGTHGRGIWVMHDITPLEELSPTTLASASHLFTTQTATSYNLYTPQGWTPAVYAAPNPPQGARIRYYLKDDLATTPAVVAANGNGSPNGASPNGAESNDSVRARLVIVDAQGETVRELDGPGTAGIHEVIWDLRLPPPYEPEENQQEQRGFFRTPRGPKVLPGQYAVRLEAAGTMASSSFTVRLDQRIEISEADLQARQDAMLSMYALAKPMHEAGLAVRRLNELMSDVKKMLRDNEDAPDSLEQEVDSLSKAISETGRKLTQVGRGARGSFAIEASTTRPTADQLWQIERAWERVPDLITELNDYITDAIPELYRKLDEHGIRPDAGETVDVPKRR